MPKLTQRFLESLRADQDGETVRDGGNLNGLVRAKIDGSVSVYFTYSYRSPLAGKKHTGFSCGTWPNDSLTVIRARRDDARRQVKNKCDPAVQKKIDAQKKQEADAAKLAEIERQRTDNLTVQDLFDVWLDDGVRRSDGNAELQRAFDADVLPTIGTTPIKALTEHDLRAVLRTMVARGVNRAAVVMRNNLTQMFAWAEKRQPWRKLLADGNPMDLIEIEKIVSPNYDMDNQRDRILSADEIRQLRDIFVRMQADYDAAPDRRATVQPLEKTVRCAIWIMLSTLCRVGELSKARWKDVDLEAGEWRIPIEAVKGKSSALTVYLSDFTLDQFRELHKLTGVTDWCFPAKQRKGHVCKKSISKQVGDRQVMFKKGRDGKPRKPMKNRRHDNTLVLGEGRNGAWTPHDLRRTGATLMQSLGVPMHVIDRCQNHVLEGSKVRRHYFHHDYANEKRAAWQQLADRLSLILNAPSHVMAFHRAA